jgi:hypothetical protein
MLLLGLRGEKIPQTGAEQIQLFWKEILPVRLELSTPGALLLRREYRSIAGETTA